METEDEQYHPQAIYSMDETLCFDPQMPIRSLACALLEDVKQDKVRLTVAVCWANHLGLISLSPPMSTLLLHKQPDTWVTHTRNSIDHNYQRNSYTSSLGSYHNMSTLQLATCKLWMQTTKYKPHPTNHNWQTANYKLQTADCSLLPPFSCSWKDIGIGPFAMWVWSLSPLIHYFTFIRAALIHPHNKTRSALVKQHYHCLGTSNSQPWCI